MMKKIALLIVVGIFGLTGMVSAQTFTNVQALRQATIRLKIAYDANYAKALSLAKKNGWPLTITTKEKRIGVLVGVDDFNLPKYYITNNNTIAAATTRANQLWPGGSTGLNLSGSTPALKNKLAIWDGGAVLATHVEFNGGRVTQKDNPSGTSDHSTHVAGTMIAAGVNPSAKGMAYALPGMIAYDFNNDQTEIASEAAGLLLSNHSYSIIAGWNYNSDQSRWEFNGRPNENEDYKFGYYSDDAASLDDIAYNAPNYLIVKSAGNSRGENGPAVGSPYFRPNASGTMQSAGNRPAGISSNDAFDIISWDCTAKNVLTVGAVPGLPNGYSRKEDVALTDFSAWGPTDDGRIKPDIVADGVNVLSSINTSTTSYASYTGTSMSAPNATGSLLLIQEYYSKLKGGAFLRSATLKGLAIHTANEAGSSPGPDYKFGWGLLNVERAAAVITAAVPSNNAATSTHLLYENTLAQGASFSINVVASGKGPLQATICWTDVKGTVDKVNVLNNPAKKLINDLDIRITKGSGASLRTYLPWTLDPANPSFPAAPGDNITDNVERIDIDSTVPGQTYTITVTHKGTLVKGPQAYSLLVSGVGGTPYCASSSTGGGARIDSVGFKNIQVANSAGSKTYTDNTKYVADIEPGQSNTIAIRVNTADATSNPRIVKVFIDYNNNGVFDLPSELVATSPVLTSATQVYTTAAFVTPTTLNVDNICLMRIVVQETSNASDILPCGTNYGKGETQDYRLRVVSPSNDMTISEIVAPQANDCANGQQYLTITLRNNGSNTQSNIPITANIVTGSTTVANLAFTYPGPINALSTATYTFQLPFVTTAATIYTITATVNLPNDQYSSNNSIVSTIITAPKPAPVSAVGSVCNGTLVNLKVNSPDASNYFWYATATGTSPFAAGPTTSTTTIPTDKTYYVAKEAKVSIGPVNKTTLNTQGGYNMFLGNYVKINNTVPVLLETARLYIGWPGKIRFTLANLLTETSSSFSYQPLAVSTIDVYPTTTSPAPGAVTSNSAADTGAIYLLNIPVVTAGDHIIIIECLDRSGIVDTFSNLGATIFRNNGITGATYPISIPNIMSITGNSAHNTPGSTDAQFYYFFYDMKVNTFNCVSDRIAVVAGTSPTPTITLSGTSLVSSIATGNQWFLDGLAISGANSASYTPTKTGKYKVVVTDVFGCQTSSADFPYTVTAIPVVDPREIGLVVSPNPNNGIFNLSFEVTTKADLSIEIVSASGQRVYNSTYKDFTGKFSKQIVVDEVSSEFYILKIIHNKKSYLQKLLIVR